MRVCSWALSTPTLVGAKVPVLITPARLQLSQTVEWVASEAHLSPFLPPFWNSVCVSVLKACCRLNAAASVLAFGRENAFNSCSLATVAQPRC